MAEHLILAAFLGCVVGGFLPWVNAELIVTGTALLVTGHELVLLALVAAAGQMVAKIGLYSVARWAPARLPARARRALGRAHELQANRRTASLAVLASATVGLPPFYLVTLAAGLVRVPLVIFIGAGLCGMLLRYGALVVGASAIGGNGLF